MTHFTQALLNMAFTRGFTNTLPTHIAWVFEILYEIITRLIHVSDKNAEEK